MEIEDSVKGRSVVRGGKVLGRDPGESDPGGGCALEGRGGLSQRKGRPGSAFPPPQSPPQTPATVDPLLTVARPRAEWAQSNYLQPTRTER